MIILLKLKYSNAYLVDGKILVDTGSPGETDNIEAALRRAGVALSDLRLILHTHIHGDHAGSTATLHQQSQAPVAYHPADEPLMTQGHNGTLHGIGAMAGLLGRLLSNAPFPTCPADVSLQDELRLDEYGVAGTVYHTPGHTAGSVSLLLDSGEAIIGDLMMGGYMGGQVLRGRPGYHYFADDLPTLRRSIRRLVNELAPHTLYVGHGGPLKLGAVKNRFVDILNC